MNIQDIKRSNSESKINTLIQEFRKHEEISAIPNLSIFVAGSYARNEASEHSDIDLFFVLDGKLEDIDEPNIKTLRLFSKIVEIADKLELPKFSNDGQYLQIIEKPMILNEMGSSKDDHLNYFTARMLMILESKCIHGEDYHEQILKDLIGAYLKDYPDHPKDFHPTFLVNDIIRFWKTLCLNYENKRNQPVDDPQKRISQKLKNLKLKFSRMLTCYASICYVVSLEEPMGSDSLVAMADMAPLERLRTVVYGKEKYLSAFEQLEDEYRWFLELTNVSEADLKEKFAKKELRTEAFRRADKFGDSLYSITKGIAEDNNYLRFLLV
ncbi:MAG: nucleotidyltransferase domain-containing protein [Ruegeria sp.]